MCDFFVRCKDDHHWKRKYFVEQDCDGPYDSDLSGLKMGLPDLRVTVIVFYILYRSHPFNVLLLVGETGGL